MNARRCKVCGATLYGRADKVYCSSTCRRDASRVRKRRIRIGEYTFFGSERRQSDSIEEFLIPRLVQQYGSNHKIVRDAKRQAEEVREAELEKLSEAMRL